MAEDKLKALRYQALQNETLKNRDFLEIGGAIYKRHKIDKSAVMEGNLIPLQRGDAFWLIEEIERLRAVVAQQATENAALRTALQTIEVLMSDISDDEQLRRAVNSAANAGLLDAKPDAAPAPVEPAARRPMLGDTLKNAITEGKRVFVKATGERGIVFSIFSTEGGRKYRVEHGGEYADYNRDEIELAPVEAAAAREIAVGDRVRITIEGSIREGAKGKVIAINPDYEACYAVELVATNGKHFVIGDYRPGEIELV